MSNDESTVLQKLVFETRDDIKTLSRDLNTKLDMLVSGEAPPCKQMNARVTTIEDCIVKLRDSATRQGQLGTLKIGRIVLTSRHAELAFIVLILAGAIMWRDLTYAKSREEIDSNIQTLKRMIGGVTLNTTGEGDVRMGTHTR